MGTVVLVTVAYRSSRVAIHRASKRLGNTYSILEHRIMVKSNVHFRLYFYQIMPFAHFLSDKSVSFYWSFLSEIQVWSPPRPFAVHTSWFQLVAHCNLFFIWFANLSRDLFLFYSTIQSIHKYLSFWTDVHLALPLCPNNLKEIFNFLTIYHR